VTRGASLPQVGDVRGKGLLIGIELVEDEESKQSALPDKVMAAISGCQERGLIVGKNGDTVLGFPNVLMVSPPLNITDEDLRSIAEVVGESLNRVAER
jgi:taurine-pyruvate aminotransferase